MGLCQRNKIVFKTWRIFVEGKSIIGQIGVVFGTLLAIAVILYLAYAATKLLGKTLFR